MARTLIANVWVNGRGYGPSFGPDLPPADVELPDHVWADGGGGVDDADDRVEHVMPDPPATEGERDQSETGAVLRSDGSMVGWGSLDDLDKPQLLELAEARGVEVDRRWGVKRLRATLRDAEEA